MGSTDTRRYSSPAMRNLLTFLKEQGLGGILITSPTGDAKIAVLRKDLARAFSLIRRFARDEGFDLRIRPIRAKKVLRVLPVALTQMVGHRRYKVELSGGEKASFELEGWKDEGEYFESASPNHISRRLWKTTAEAHGLFTGAGIKDYAAILPCPHALEPAFPIDLVFTWVNADDPDWQRMFSQYAPEPVTVAPTNDATARSRYYSRDELKYALRSWAENGTFIRKIFIVSNCRPPEWLNLESEQIAWIPHEQILPADALPTFNSHAIEACLHKIPGLANHFIYSNDDVFLARKAFPSDFFLPSGLVKVRLEPYGQVNGEPHPDHPAYLNGARNGKALLEREFGRSATQLTSHTFHALRVDILREMEAKFDEAFYRTIRNRFRSPNDISVTSYLHSHYCVLSGKGIADDTPVWLVQNNHRYRRRLAKLLRRKKTEKELPLSLCLNDGKNSDNDRAWDTAVRGFLNTFFPNPSPFEK